MSWDLWMECYICAAGGCARDVDEGIRVVQQSNGLVEMRARPELGATVVVPRKDPEDRRVDVVPLFTNIAQIFAATATVIVVLTSEISEPKWKRFFLDVFTPGYIGC